MHEFSQNYSRGEVERSNWWPLAAVAAAPFDYAIDPALTLVTTPLYCLVYMVGISLSDYN